MLCLIIAPTILYGTVTLINCRNKPTKNHNIFFHQRPKHEQFHLSKTTGSMIIRAPLIFFAIKASDFKEKD
jgi:hypothetical protein